MTEYGLIKTAARKDRTVLPSLSLCKQPSSEAQQNGLGCAAENRRAFRMFLSGLDFLVLLC